MEFVTQNIFLITLALISGIALLLPVLRDAREQGKTVTAAQAVMLINRQHAVVVDVRDEAELAAGSLAGARHIPAGELATRVSELEKFKNRPIVLVCATGARSGRAVATLNKAGFAQAFSLDGGVKGWKDAGQPLVSTGKKA